MGGINVGTDAAREASSASWIGGSALRGPLLRLLLEHDRPIGAYRLSSLLMQRLPGWQLTHSSIANLLKRLVEEGYVTCQSGPTQVYLASERAALAIEEWMRTPLSRHAVRDELHARIASSRPQHAPLLFKALQDYEQECFDSLQDGGRTDAPSGSWRGLTISLTGSAVEENLNANIRWSRIARRWIRDWVENSRDQAVSSGQGDHDSAVI
jgi:DNA-binding PadR family transcriptional regulator